MRLVCETERSCRRSARTDSHKERMRTKGYKIYSGFIEIDESMKLEYRENEYNKLANEIWKYYMRKILTDKRYVIFPEDLNDKRMKPIWRHKGWKGR